MQAGWPWSWKFSAGIKTKYFNCSNACKQVGCGAGNTIFPLFTTYPDIFVHACDFSPRAINLVKVSVCHLSPYISNLRWKHWGIVLVFLCSVMELIWIGMFELNDHILKVNCPMIDNGNMMLAVISWLS